MKVLLLLALVASAAANGPKIMTPNVVEFDSTDFEASAAKSGKAFIVFYEETCAHCKKLLPAWDKLGAEYYGVKDVIIGKVDCKKEWKKDTIFAEAAQDLDNKALCEKYNPTGLRPRIKLFAAGTNDLGDLYEGGREFEELKVFADATLGPVCSSENIGICTKAQKKKLEEVNAMNGAEIQVSIYKKLGAVEYIGERYKADIKKLQREARRLARDADGITDIAKEDIAFLKHALARNFPEVVAAEEAAAKAALAARAEEAKAALLAESMPTVAGISKK